MHNNLQHFICHSFDDQGWHDPALATAEFVHVDLSRETDNERLNEMSILSFLKTHTWKDPMKKFIGLGHYRRWLDLSSIDRLENGTAYVHFERQPMHLDKIWEVYHSKEYLDTFFQLLDKEDSALSAQLKSWMASDEAQEKYCARNLLVLPKTSFLKWMNFMHKMADIAMRTAAQLADSPIWQDKYQKRQPGFLLERIDAFWLSCMSGLKLQDTPVRELHIFSPYQRELRTCVVAVQRDEANVEEWCRWHLDVCKFSNVVLFNDRCPEQKLPDSIASRVIQIPALEAKHQAVQFMCYNWFLQTLSSKFDMALFIDLDEHLVLHGQTIEQHVWERGTVLAEAFNWVYFGSKTVGEWPADSLVKRFRHRAALPNKHVKVLLDLRMMRARPDLQLVFCNPHYVHSAKWQCIIPAADVQKRLFTGPYNPAAFSPADFPYIAHYYCKTEAEFQKKIDRGRCDCFDSSDSQYYRQQEHMWDEFRKCDRDEVFDGELAEAMMACRA